MNLDETYKAPAIAPIPHDTIRPRWSVMIPTYNCAHYLRQALESVLSQDPGPDAMQIEVVDDFSTKDDPEAVVKAVGQGRVGFYRQPQNGGVVANFNTCIQRSKGHLIHILHGDDYVLPGFYTRIEATSLAHPSLAAFFTRCFVVEEDGALATLANRIESLESPTCDPGRLLYDNHLFPPGIVIQRTFYEAHGGFLPALPHVADWEMWVRSIAADGGVMLNEPLAAYRFFPGSDTGRLARSAENLKDYLRLSKIFVAHFDAFDPLRFRDKVAHRAMQQARKFRHQNDLAAEEANWQLWRQLTPTSKRWSFEARRVLRRMLTSFGILGSNHKILSDK